MWLVGVSGGWAESNDGQWAVDCRRGHGV